MSRNIALVFMAVTTICMATAFGNKQYPCPSLDHSTPIVSIQEKLFTTEDLLVWLTDNRPTRMLKQWHIHHTWDPSYADFNWNNHQELQAEMKLLHVDGNGWDDIGQHFTLFPDGLWMMGRDIEWDPASIRGWNQGAVAVEIVGNFDVGEDQMTAMQEDAIVSVSQFMVQQWKLTPHFHRDHPDSGKTCPGSGIDRDLFMFKIQSSAENDNRSQ